MAWQDIPFSKILTWDDLVQARDTGGFSVKNDFSGSSKCVTRNNVEWALHVAAMTEPARLATKSNLTASQSYYQLNTSDTIVNSSPYDACSILTSNPDSPLTIYTTNPSGLINAGDTIYQQNMYGGYEPINPPEYFLAYRDNTQTYVWVQLDNSGLVVNTGTCVIE